MSGYSVNWGHKAPKTTIPKEQPVIVHNVISPQLQPISTNVISTISTPAKKWRIPAQLKTIPLSQIKNIHSSHVTSTSMVSSPTKVDKGQPQFFTGDEQEDDHARKSLIYGILSLGSPAAAFLIMFGIVLSVGGTLAKPAGYAVAIFLLGCAGGLVFAITAIINGFIAIQEINAAPDTYIGKGDAVLGILLAALVPIGIVGYLVVRFGLKK
jgi:hypothetical protein